MPLEHLWWGHVEEKSRAKKGLLEQIMEFANCIWENYDIIIKAINSL
jgi:hypothetical protein